MSSLATRAARAGFAACFGAAAFVLVAYATEADGTVTSPGSETSQVAFSTSEALGAQALVACDDLVANEDCLVLTDADEQLTTGSLKTVDGVTSEAETAPIFSGRFSLSMILLTGAFLGLATLARQRKRDVWTARRLG